MARIVVRNARCRNTWGEDSPCPYHSGIATAVQILHILSPILVFSFFLTASIILFFKPVGTINQSPKRTSRKALELSLTGIVGFLYILEAVAILAYPRHGLILPPTGSHKTALDLDLVFTLYSTLVWLVLFLATVSSDDSAKDVNFLGAWRIAFGLELLLFTLNVADDAHLNSRAMIAQTIIQALRLLSIGSLVAQNVLGSRAPASDEEITPLLGNLASTEHAFSQIADVTTSYGTSQVHVQSEDTTAASSDNGSKTAASGDSAGKTTSEEEEDDDDDEDEDFKDAAKKVGQNWWQYVKTFKVFLPYMWPGRSRRLQLHFIGSLGCLLSERVLNVLVPFSLGKVITGLGQSGGAHVPWIALSSFIILGLLNNASGLPMFQRFLWYSIQRDSMFRLKTATYNHLMNLSCDFHAAKKSGKIWQLTLRGYHVVMLFRTIVTELIPTTADLVIAVSVFFIMFDAYVGFLIGVTSVLYWWSTMITTSRAFEFQRVSTKDWEKEYYQMSESTQHWTTVSYFNRHPYEKERYRSHVDKSQESMYRRWTFANLVDMVKKLIVNVGLFAACTLVCIQVASGQRDVGEFAFLVVYWEKLSAPLEHFATGFKDIAEQLIDAEKLLALLRKVPSVRDDEGASDFILKHGAVKFENVFFSYDGKRQVSNKISFEVKPGETVALVGETGSGKSTILRLLFRFYDPTEGRILVDGQDIRKVALDSYRNHVGVVPQDPILFNTSIYENLRYGNLDATEEQIQAACRAVALHDRIMSLTQGYNEVVGERGVKLSTGELQRVAIARAILRNPQILLLDEATSSVDTKTEFQIQKSLAELSENRTTIVIAHRLSTIVNAHKILVIMNGEVVEQGSHAELIKRKGPYQELWVSQRLAVLGDERCNSNDRSRSRSLSKTRPALVNDLTSSAEGKSLIEQLGSEIVVDKSKSRVKAKSKSKSRRRKSASPVDDGHEHTGHTKSHKPEQDRGRSPTKGVLHGLRRQVPDSVSTKRFGLSTSAPSSSLSSQTILKPDAPEFVPKGYQNAVLSASVSPTRSTDELIKKALRDFAEPKKTKPAGHHAADQCRPAEATSDIQVPCRSSSIATLKTIREEEKRNRLRGRSRSPKRESHGKTPSKSVSIRGSAAPEVKEGGTVEVEGFRVGGSELEGVHVPGLQVEGCGIEGDDDIEREDVDATLVDKAPVEESKRRYHLWDWLRRRKSASEPVTQFDGLGDSDEEEADRARPCQSGGVVGDTPARERQALSTVGRREVTLNTPGQSRGQTPESGNGTATSESSPVSAGHLQAANGHVKGASLGSDDTEIASGTKVYAPANTPASPASPAGGDEGERGLFENYERNRTEL